MAKTKAWRTFWIMWTRILGDLTRRHTSTFCTLLLIYMTFKLNVKCLWQHPATSNHLEITEAEWSEASDLIVITIHSLRQLQPGAWKILIKRGSEELTSLLSGLQEITKFPHFRNTHFLTRHSVKELIRQCQSWDSDDQAASPKRNKTNYNQTDSKVDVSYFKNFRLALFWWHWLYSGTLFKNLDVLLVVVQLLL